MVPWDVLVEGRPLRLGQYARSWTVPEFRNQGVSVAIGNALNAHAQELGYPIVFLFPSVRSIPGHRRIGNRIDTLLERRQAVLSLKARWPGAPGVLDPLLRAVQRRRRPGNAARDWTRATNLEGDAGTIWSRLAAEPPAAVIGARTPEFVRWRYDATSGREYAIWRRPLQGPARQLAVTRRVGRRARVVDFWGAADAQESAHALAGLVQVLEVDAHLVEWCPPAHPPFSKAAAGAGLARRRVGVPVARWFVQAGSEGGPLGDVRQYALTEGDSDYA
jgi:hypothetical protein